MILYKWLEGRSLQQAFLMDAVEKLGGPEEIINMHGDYFPVTS